MTSIFYSGAFEAFAENYRNNLYGLDMIAEWNEDYGDEIGVIFTTEDLEVVRHHCRRLHCDFYLKEIGRQGLYDVLKERKIDMDVDVLILAGEYLDSALGLMHAIYLGEDTEGFEEAIRREARLTFDLVPKEVVDKFVDDSYVQEKLYEILDGTGPFTPETTTQYKIETLEKLFGTKIEFRMPFGDDCSGTYRVLENTVVVMPTVDPREMEFALCHELVHVWMYSIIGRKHHLYSNWKHEWEIEKSCDRNGLFLARHLFPHHNPEEEDFQVYKSPGNLPYLWENLDKALVSMVLDDVDENVAVV